MSPYVAVVQSVAECYSVLQSIAMCARIPQVVMALQKQNREIVPAI